MFSTFTVVSLLTTASAVFAQSSSGSATSTSTASGLVPTGLSSSCESYLSSLNSNSQLASCLSPMLSATASFANGGSTPSSSDLDKVSSASMCDDSTLRSTLSDFSSNCPTEMTSNPAVILLYDSLYVLSPMKTALTAKSDSGSYCALSSSSNSSSSSVASQASEAQKYISLSDGTLNGTTFSSTNLPFMFHTTVTSSDCTTCLRQIVTPYINYMSNTPYAPGTANSVLLSGQPTLYQNIQQTCGSNFLSGAVQAAGGLGTGSKTSGERRSVGMDLKTGFAVLGGMIVAAML